MQRSPRVRDERHLKFIRTLPCAICGQLDRIEAAHIRFADAEYDKRSCGFGEKPSDMWSLPLCQDHHREQHAMGDERRFWQDYSIDPLPLARAIYGKTGNRRAAVIWLTIGRGCHG